MAMQTIPVPDSLIQQVTELNSLGLPSNIKHYCYMKSKVCAFLFHLFDTLNGFSLYADSKFTTRDYEDILVLLNSLVNQHHLTLKAIASELNYSQRHTARLIKQMYNMTLSEIYENDIPLCDDLTSEIPNEEEEYNE